MNSPASTLGARREKAREAFRASGVPNRRVEEWKYSDLRQVFDVAADFPPAGIAGVDPFSETGSSPFLIVNGILQNGLGRLPSGVEAFDLSDISRDAPKWVIQTLGTTAAKEPMAAASLANMRGGVAVRVKKNFEVKVPLHILVKAAGFTRVLLVLEEKARLTFLESHSQKTKPSESTLVTDLGTEIFLHAGACLNHIRSAAKESDSVLVETIAVSTSSNAIYKAHFANFGAKLSRTEVHIALEGEGAQAHLSGVSVLDGTHADVTTHVMHAVGKTQSTQLFKYVASGHARGVYQGKVTVAEGANGSDSRQTAKGLLLEDRAEIDLKPELEIFADDVKCAHGAAVGDLDAESLFYLRSRGIPENEARALLMRAFIGDAVEQIESEAERAAIWQAVDAALEGLS